MYVFPVGPLGISFGEVMHPNSPSSIEIVSKIAGTTASQYDALKIGDFLVQIGSYAVHDVDFSVAMDLVLNEPRPVKLYFARDNSKDDATVKRRPENNPEDLMVYSFNDDQFGIMFGEKTDSADNTFVYVDNILPNGEANRFPSLNIGDILVRIDTKSVRDLKLDEIIETLKTISNRPLDLGFIHGNELSMGTVTKEDYCCTFLDGPYGMELGDVNINGTIAVEVVKISQKGLAAQTKLIKPLDRLVRVGEVNVAGMVFGRVISLLQDAKRPVEIGFQSAK